ncbi:F0F1 ATP synthase subunit A [Agrococcus sediminis]|uniref:ATP synthase subunit a n=1 Tax=Agrococcus sediminis TaxID=2599924 RepID=A0A5M8QAP0_9MICO|nr:F0F1 ATP synthase subunit A [Agrococcus sediminis]KAA6432228.1 F0F1 ATP synthase subunit A [Agrococcus sediminis]RWR20725.1 ATP synthase F0 subunit A [Agrococcus lahaulensis]
MLFADPTIEWFGSDEPIFGINRIMLIRMLSALVIILIFVLGTRRMRLIPTRGQSIVEMGLGFVRDGIAYDLLGEKDGKRFLPLITTIFFMVLSMNITGIVPFLNIAGTGVIGVPLLLALVAYGAFIYAGVKKHPGAFFKNALFPPGVPKALYIIVTPIEFVSTFVLRPITLTLRLMMNMVVGHLLLVLFFAATQFFFFSAGGFYTLFGVGTLAFGFAFTLFEILVAVLQAYVFALLTTVYIQLALAEEH